MATPNVDGARAEALAAAAVLFTGTRPRSAAGVLAIADELTAWLLRRPARLALSAAPLTFQQGVPGPGTPTKHHHSGGSMSVSMTDAQQVTYTVEAEDSKGFEVADSLTWSEDSAGAVVAMTVSEDGMSATFAAVAPGTATVSVTDGTLSASDSIDVTAGGAASLVLTPGTVTDEA